MGLLNLASMASAWRGYECYTEKKVLKSTKISDSEFEGILKGSGGNKYDVFIDIEHPRKSHCNCPHAKGKRIICKHQVALYFSEFPKEAENYYKRVIEYEEEEERRQEEIDKKIIAYINSLSKEELRQILYNVIYDNGDYVYERFVNEHIDYDF